MVRAFSPWFLGGLVVEGRWPSKVWGAPLALRGLVPHVAFVVVHAVVREGRAVLVLESFGAVMFGLGVDVMNQRLEIGEAEGECTVTALPCEIGQIRRLKLQPLG
jgi:hypothetical protein